MKNDLCLCSQYGPIVILEVIKNTQLEVIVL